MISSSIGVLAHQQGVPLHLFYVRKEAKGASWERPDWPPVPADELPVSQGRHHGYHDSDPEYRDAESKRTYDRLLKRFRGREGLLAPRP